MDNVMVINRKTVLSCLRRRYKEIGKDFYFKSRHLRINDIDNRVIGRIVLDLVKEGFVKMWNPDRSSCSHTFVTNFKKNNIGG